MRDPETWKAIGWLMIAAGIIWNCVDAWKRSR